MGKGKNESTLKILSPKLFFFEEKNSENSVNLKIFIKVVFFYPRNHLYDFFLCKKPPLIRGLKIFINILKITLHNCNFIFFFKIIVN